MGKLNNIPESIFIDSIPGDKSISHRAIIIGSISKNPSSFTNFLFSEDCLCTIDIFKKLGVEIHLDKDKKSVNVQGVGLRGLQRPSTPLWVGNSGTSIRLISGILVAQNFPSEITGDASILQRPMKRIIDPLSKMGALIDGASTKEGDIVPPLQISPSSYLKPYSHELAIASAQVKSALLFASLYINGVTSIKEPLLSRTHTEKMLKSYGASIKIKDGIIFSSGINELSNPYPESEIFIPSDFSSAAFFIGLALITKKRLVLKHININPTRSHLLVILKKMGAKISIDNHFENIEPFADITILPSELNNITVDTDDIPKIIDEIPILSIIALFSNGTLSIKKARELRVKESDRIESIYQMLSSLGVKNHIDVYHDGFDIHGNAKLSGGSVRSFGDHRIAMSAIIAGLSLNNQETLVENVSCIATSFPNFFSIIHEINQGAIQQ